MKKILTYIGLFLFFLAFFLIGLFFMDSIMRLASYPYDVLIWCGMICGFLYLYRNHTDGLVKLFKEVHQSNLDDIEEQEKKKLVD